jgi:predicted nucleic acid-binding protein
MIYLDSSFLVSLHFRDANTPSALALVRSASEPLLISSLVELETVNAFCRRVFRKQMTITNMQNAVRDLEKDIQSGVLQLQALPHAAFTRGKVLAQTLTPSLGIRSADLLHLAAALELGATTFYTFDERQHKAAQAAGLAVNPLP